MESSIIKLPQIKLIGLKVYTGNQDEFNPDKAQIGRTIQEYCQKYLNQNSNIVNNSKLYSVYFEYESNHKGKYSYLIGQEVEEFLDLPEELTAYIIPSQTYKIFETNTGIMPHVVIDAWKEIWSMEDNLTIGCDRSYIADFEAYDLNQKDPLNMNAEIYIGIK